MNRWPTAQRYAAVVQSTGLMPVALDEPPGVKVITSGGFTAAFDILGPIFGQASGIEVVTEYGSSMGGGPESIPVRLARGEDGGHPHPQQTAAR